MAAPPARTRLGRLGALIVMAPALAALSVALNVSLAAIVYHARSPASSTAALR